MTPDDQFRIRDIKKYTHSDIRHVAFRENGFLETDDGIRLSQYLKEDASYQEEQD